MCCLHVICTYIITSLSSSYYGTIKAWWSKNVSPLPAACNIWVFLDNIFAEQIGKKKSSYFMSELKQHFYTEKYILLWKLSTGKLPLSY